MELTIILCVMCVIVSLAGIAIEIYRGNLTIEVIDGCEHNSHNNASDSDVCALVVRDYSIDLLHAQKDKKTKDDYTNTRRIEKKKSL